MTDHKDLIRATMPAQTTAAEMALFLSAVERTGLDRLARQIYAVRRWDQRAKRETQSIQVSIDGLRLIAQRY